MNTITFDDGVKRRLVLPAAIVLSAHAALFLGFVGHPAASIPIPTYPHEPVDQPIEVPLPEETTVTNGDSQSRNTSDQEQQKEIRSPVPLDPPDWHEIAIAPRIPLISPGNGSGFPDNLGPSIGLGGSPVSPDSLDHTPEATRQPQPIYPLDAKTSGTSGEVVVAFVVDESGRVLNPRVVSSSDPIFDEATLRAIGQWRFAPGTRHGVPVRFRMSVPVAFHLDR
jgi:protein TonB